MHVHVVACKLHAFWGFQDEHRLGRMRRLICVKAGITETEEKSVNYRLGGLWCAVGDWCVLFHR